MDPSLGFVLHVTSIIVFVIKLETDPSDCQDGDWQAASMQMILEIKVASSLAAVLSHLDMLTC